MKKCFFLVAIISNFGYSFFSIAQIDENPYHYNKVYDYENDTIPTVSFHKDSVCKMATRLIGTPYLSPGRSLKGFDCSGLTFYCFQAHGIYLPYSAHEQALIGNPISFAEVESGDLLFFQGHDLTDKGVHHVAIAINKKGEKIKFVHATSKGVHIDTMESPYYKPRFISIRRVY